MEVKIIPIDRIRPSPLQPRERFDKEKIKELGESIFKWGLIQPIVVNPNPKKDEYVIIAGERRWRAMKLMGIKHVSAVIKNINYNQFLVESLIENIHREDLTDVEKVRALEEIRKLNKIPKETGFFTKLSELVSTSSNNIRDWYDSVEMRKEISVGPAEVTQSVISETKGLEKEDRKKVIEKAIEEDWGGRKVRKFVSAIKRTSEPIKKTILEQSLEPEVVEEIAKIEEPEVQKQILKKAKKLSPEGVRDYIQIIKEKEESEPVLIKEAPVGNLICPACNKKFKVIHQEPKGHKLVEVFE